MTFLSKLPANYEAMYTVSSGTRGKTHDLYDTVRESVMDIRWKIPMDVSTARNHLMAALLGKTSADLGNKPQGFSVSHSRMVWRFSAVWRFGFEKDGGGNYNTCILPALAQKNVDAALKPYLNLFSGITDPEAAATFHVIGGVCKNTCNAMMAHGYKELAQKLSGQVMDVCQKDLGQSMQGILDNVLGQASSLRLKHTPINASLVVGLNGQEVPRSRVQGFDFRPSNNSLVLLNYPYKKGSEVAMAYERWRQ